MVFEFDIKARTFLCVSAGPDYSNSSRGRSRQEADNSTGGPTSRRILWSNIHRPSKAVTLTEHPPKDVSPELHRGSFGIRDVLIYRCSHSNTINADTGRLLDALLADALSPIVEQKFEATE